MIIVSLTYKVPLEQVDEHMDAHIAWLKEGYAAGVFVASGRKKPRTGGVIMAKGEREQVEELCANDPFIVHNIADMEIIDVSFSTVADGFEALQAPAN